jgi:hypothetical protein
MYISLIKHGNVIVIEYQCKILSYSNGLKQNVWHQGRAKSQGDCCLMGCN